MSRSDAERLDDIAAAIAAVRLHLQRGPLTDGLVFDAVRVRLIEIGEAVKALPDSITGQEPDLPWRDIAQMRDFMAHRYFDTAYGVIESTVTHDLPLLAAAVSRLQIRIGTPD